jgi:small subunit ribosomal protein S9
MAVQYYEGVGRRKESIARVRIMSGSGQFTINTRPVQDYFTRYGDLNEILGTLQAVGESPEQLDISVVVTGGGVTGQTDAVKMGIARALVTMKPDYRSILRKGGYLTRDPRVKERKKPGLKRARKAPTYTKR